MSGLVLLLCIAPSLIYADGKETRDTIPLPGGYRLLSDSGSIEIPFEIYRGDIRFQCQVDGRPTYMLLDDGFMWDDLLFWGGPEVDSLNLVYDAEVGIGDDGSDKLESRTASDITVRLPGVEFTDQSAVVTPYSSGNSRMWSGSIGQISAAFFKNFIVDINFDKMVITLIKPQDFNYEGNGVAVEWKPMGFGPWSIPAEIHLDDGREIGIELMMDLGYNDQLQLATGSDNNIRLTGTGLPATLGFNIQGVETRGQIGRLPGIEIGGYRLENLIVCYVSEENRDQVFAEAMVGLGLLSRFNLVFDCYGHRLFVEPNKSFDSSFEFNMSGFMSRPNPCGGRIVTRVYEDSPADESGLKAGDIIREVNGKPATQYDYFDLESMFLKVGATVNMRIDRAGEELDISIVLRRVI